MHHVDQDRFTNLVPKEVQNSIPEQASYKHLSGKTNFCKPEKFVFLFKIPKVYLCVGQFCMFEIFTELDQHTYQTIKSEIFKALHQF